MGVEIETAYALTTSETDRANLRLYLNHSWRMVTRTPTRALLQLRPVSAPGC